MKKLPSKLARGSLKLIKLFYLIRARRKIKALQDEKQEEEKEKERILEVERRRLGQEMIKAKQLKEEQETKRLADERKKEKLNEELAKKRVLEQIQRDRYVFLYLKFDSFLK